MATSEPQEDQSCQPDEVDEGVDEHFEEDRSVLVEPVGDHEEILTTHPIGPDRDLVRRLLLGQVAVLARRDRAQVFISALDAEPRSQLERVRAPPLVAPEKGDGVVADAQRLARLKPRRALGGERTDPDCADEEDDDSRVDEVAAVTAAIASDQPSQRTRPATSSKRAPRARAAHELERYRRENERREGVADEPGRTGARTRDDERCA